MIQPYMYMHIFMLTVINNCDIPCWKYNSDIETNTCFSNLVLEYSAPAGVLQEGVFFQCQLEHSVLGLNK